MKIFLAADGSAGLKVARLIKAAGFQWIGLAAPNTSANAAMLKLAAAQAVRSFEGSCVKKRDLAEWLREQQVDVILSIHTKYIMIDEVLAAPRIGAFNLHPGPLPAYAGRNPVSWAIYNGETQHGATLHRMTPTVDGGAIVGIAHFPIEPEETALELMAKTSNEGVSLVRDFLQKLAAAEPIIDTPQDSSKSAYYDRRVPQGGQIDWTRTAADVVNFVRAADFGPFPSPWGYPQFKVRGKIYRLIKAQVSERKAEANPGTIYELEDVPMANASDRFVKLVRIDPPELT